VGVVDCQGELDEDVLVAEAALLDAVGLVSVWIFNFRLYSAPTLRP
jgi:hypothetical protein